MGEAGLAGRRARAAARWKRPQGLQCLISVAKLVKSRKRGKQIEGKIAPRRPKKHLLLSAKNQMNIKNLPQCR